MQCHLAGVEFDDQRALGRQPGLLECVGADVIVVGSCELSDWKGLLPGSTSHQTTVRVVSTVNV